MLPAFAGFVNAVCLDQHHQNLRDISHIAGCHGTPCRVFTERDTARRTVPWHPVAFPFLVLFRLSGVFDASPKIVS